MNADELVAQVRHSAYISDSHPVYTDARIRIELWNALVSLFGNIVLSSRSGYWRQHELITLVAGRQAYRLPERALAKVVDLVEVLDGSDYRKLTQLDQREAGGLHSESGDPVYYEIGADYLYLHPTPSAAGTMRVKFPLRPPKLVQAQTKGLVTGFDHTSSPLTIGATVPDGYYATGSAVPVTDSDLIDVVNPNGWSELALYSVTQSYFGSVYLHNEPVQDAYRIAVGDYVRMADESEFPMLPEEFHHTLAEAAAAAILAHMGNAGKAQLVGGKVGGELERFESQIQPRFKYSPRPLRNRRRLRGRWPIAPSS